MGQNALAYQNLALWGAVNTALLNLQSGAGPNSNQTALAQTYAANTFSENNKDDQHDRDLEKSNRQTQAQNNRQKNQGQNALDVYQAKGAQDAGAMSAQNNPYLDSGRGAWNKMMQPNPGWQPASGAGGGGQQSNPYMRDESMGMVGNWLKGLAQQNQTRNLLSNMLSGSLANKINRTGLY
jgi:hypothetical protein